jgi:predicted hydrocarbon binding protein
MAMGGMAMEKEDKLKYLQGGMLFLASVANGLEELFGRGSPGVTFRAGRTAGLKAQVERTETDLLGAFAALREELVRMGIRWDFEPYKKQSETDLIVHREEGKQLKIIFRDCMVRSCQFHYGHPQKNSLCMLQHGIFCGLLQQIYGAWADYTPIHSGENACIGLLTVKPKKPE